MILIEVAAGVGRTHAASVVGAAASAVVVVMGAAAVAGNQLWHQLGMTHGLCSTSGMAPPLSNTQAAYLPHTPHTTPHTLGFENGRTHCGTLGE